MKLVSHNLFKIRPNKMLTNFLKPLAKPENEFNMWGSSLAYSLFQKYGKIWYY